MAKIIHPDVIQNPEQNPNFERDLLTPSIEAEK